MNKVAFPLGPDMSGQLVVDLDAALRQLLDRTPTLLADPRMRAVLETSWRPEVARSAYGTTTARLVTAVQELMGLQPTGQVDQRTADAINARLREWGLLEDAPHSFVVRGAVRAATGVAVPGASVRAVSESSGTAQPIGESTTDASGRYSISYESVAGVPSFDVHVFALAPDRRGPQGEGIARSAGPIAEVDVTLPAAPAGATVTLAGTIYYENGLAAGNLKLRLYRRGFGADAAKVGETSTSADGKYQISFDTGGNGASLTLCAVDAGGKDVPLTRPLNDLTSSAAPRLNVVAPVSLQPLVPEYTRLVNDLKPIVGDLSRLASATENADQQDLTILNRATGWDARLIVLAAATERLEADGGNALPRDAVYGLLRAGLPSDKSMLAQVTPDVCEQALKRVRDAGIVDVDDAQIARFKDQFAAFARDARLSSPAPGSKASYGDLLKSSGIDDGAQARFASIYLDHRGDGAALWEKARKAGLEDAQIAKLQVQGKLAFLTANSDRLTARLQQSLGGNDPSRLVDDDFDQAQRFVDEIDDLAGIPGDRRDHLSEADRKALDVLIPPAFVAPTVEARRNLWAGEMARKVRLSYPTHVVRRALERDANDTFRLGDGRAAVMLLLKNAANQGFRLGQTPVTAFLTAHPAVNAGIAKSDAAGAQKALRTLHRTYQISPGDEAMAALMKVGLTSAYDVVALSEDAFIDQYAGELGSIAVARLVYRKAKQVSSVTYNLFTIAKKLDSEPTVYGFSPPQQARDAARTELIKHFPTLESLFGSTDFCECEQCQSVLGPAAYLVDLMQFIDAEPEIWGNFLGHWKENHGGQDYILDSHYENPYDALIGRRPDLPNIPLTCENTNTALPYIDVVNEILEYYVAHDKLEAAAARDTGDAATPDLLAQPQNVIREAYDKVRDARYPMTLPFDLWIETVRAFCEQSGAPLWTVLEALRSSEELFDPSRPYDRASTFIESLGISPVERSIFADPAPLASWFSLYGFPSAAAAKTPATDPDTNDRIDLNSAKALSRRLGVTYKELIDVIETAFVNPQLDALTVLTKLGVGIHNVRFGRDAQNRAFYTQNKDLLDKDRATLGAADKIRYDALTQDDWQKLKEIQAYDARVQEFTTKFGISTADLDAALQAVPYDEILVLSDPGAGCDFDQTILQYADGTAVDDIALLRINLFVRLWRKVGFTIAETDGALRALIPANARFEAAKLGARPLESALIQIAHLVALDRAMPLGRNARSRLLTLWTDLPTTGKTSLYAQLFLTPGVLANDAVFDDALGRYLSPALVQAMAQSTWHRAELENVASADKLDPAAFAALPRVQVAYEALDEVQALSYQGVLSANDKAAIAALSPSPALPPLLDAVQTSGLEFSLIKGHLLALQGALGLTADEIGWILEDAGSSIDTAALTIPNVSILYRYRLLAKGLKLPVRDLIRLRRLSGLNPFLAISADPLQTIADDHPFSQTLRFIEVVRQATQSGLRVEDLQYLLRHQLDETGKYRPNPDAALALVKTVADGVRSIRAAHAVPADPGSITDEQLRQELGLALPADVVGQFLAMMQGTAEFTGVADHVLAADALDKDALANESAIRECRYNAPLEQQKVTVRGVLFDADKDAIVARYVDDQGAPLPGAAALQAVLQDAQLKARAFFEQNLQEQPAKLQFGSGFLEAADFDLLFAAPAAGLTDQQLQESVRKQRKRLAETFLPYLQERLTRDLIVQTMAAATSADPSLVERLVTDASMLRAEPAGTPRTLLAAIESVADEGVSGTFFASSDGTGAALGAATLPAADTSLKDPSTGAKFRPGGASSARYSGYLSVPQTGPYRFYGRLDKKDATAELRFGHLPAPVLWSGAAAQDGEELGTGPGEYIELQAGVLYGFTVLFGKLGAGEASLLVQGETLPKASIAQLTLLPDSAVHAGRRASVLLMKTLQLAQALGLVERELRYMASNAAAFGGLDLSKLPTDASEDSEAGAQALFAQFLRLAAYAETKGELSEGTADLIDVFEAAGIADTAKVYTLIARLTRRDETTVKATAKVLFAAPVFDGEQPLRRLWEALQIVQLFGAQVPPVVNWTRIVSPGLAQAQRFAIARGVADSIKARIAPETWRGFAQPIFDKLRQRQRDALVGYVMDKQKFARIEELYEYFLVDPGMEPVVQSSRIRLAIASLQLFIQRCLLNLEKKVHPSAILNAGQWEWMKRYRVWEANRKIFLFPENWLEPEFRQDKTNLFKELEGRLLKDDVSDDMVEDAFLTYLRKLEEVARLDVVAMHLEEKDDPAQNTLHVFGRTYGQPHKYFYRRYAHEMWTAWEPVELDIDGDHLAPVVWRDRVFLFWATFLVHRGLDTVQHSTMTGKVGDASLSDLFDGLEAMNTTSNVEVHLHWSACVQGEWTTPKASGRQASITHIVSDSVANPFKLSDVLIHVSREPVDEGGVYVHLGGKLKATFFLPSPNSTPEEATYAQPPASPYSAKTPLATRYQGANGLTVEFAQRRSTEPDKTDVETPPILSQGDPAFLLLPCNNDITLGAPDAASLLASDPEAAKAAIASGLPEIAALMKPIFYEDRAQTFFVQPDVTERTMEDWQEWITRTPVPDSGWGDDLWWNGLDVVAEIPQPIPQPGPIESRNPPVDPESIVKLRGERDWLVNSTTALLYDNEVIGPTGRAGIEVRPTSDLNVAEGVRNVAIAVHPGSGVGTVTEIGAPGESSFGRSGLISTPSGLNIVGGAGLNSSLLENFNAVNRMGSADALRGTTSVHH